MRVGVRAEPPPDAPDPDGEGGFVAGAESLLFGVLVFVFGTLIVFNGWAIVDAKIVAEAGAREATRAVVEAPVGTLQGGSSAAGPLASGAGARAVTSQLPEAVASLTALSIAPGGDLRCATVTSELQVQVPLVRLPAVGWTTGSYTATGAHAERIDRYRAGLPGEADCA